MFRKSKETQSTVDPEDVDRHSKLAKTWWDLNGPSKALHTLNFVRVPFIRTGLVPTSEQNDAASLKSKKILDVGCGGGILSEGIAELGAEVTGIDASKDLIELAKRHALENKYLINGKPTYLYTTIETHSSNNTEKYDAVVASEIIEHVNDKELFVESCVRATKPNGKLFFTTPSKTRIAQFYFIFLNEYILGKIPKGTHQYEKFMTPRQLELILEKNGCSIVCTRGFFLNPFSNKWKWSDNKLIMFAIEAIKNKNNEKSDFIDY